LTTENIPATLHQCLTGEEVASEAREVRSFISWLFLLSSHVLSISGFCVAAQEFIYYMIFTGCFIITAIAAAAQATSQFPSIAATAVKR